MHILILLSLGNLFSSDMLIIAIIALMLFGGEKLPEIARTVGKGLRDFKDASEGVKREINNQINSFEEKRSEEALNQAAQKQIEANNSEPISNQPSVENTIPFNENLVNAGEGNATGENTETADVHADHITENHDASSHTDNGTTNELIKNA